MRPAEVSVSNLPSQLLITLLTDSWGEKPVGRSAIRSARRDSCWQLRRQTHEILELTGTDASPSSSLMNTDGMNNAGEVPMGRARSSPWTTPARR